MCCFAFVVAVVFGVVSKESNHERLKYSARVFAEFMLVGIILAWVLYFLPF